MSKELISQFYSSDVEAKRAAVYRVLFDRRQDLLPDLKKAIGFEQNEQCAVFMVQVAMTLEAFPRDSSTERRILELLQKGTGAGELQPSMWKYLCGFGTSQMLIATLGAMGEAIPPDALEFIDTCVNHPDPEVRAMACEKAIKSGRPTHFAYVLNLITDPDPLVAETAFCVIKSMPVNELAIVLDYALGSPDEWVLQNVAPFLPNLICNGLRQVISKVQYHKHPLVSRKAREALKGLDAIPYVTKKTKEKTDEEKALIKQTESAEAAEKAQVEATVAPAPAEKSLSFKEQMELKRQQKMEDERRKKEDEDTFAKELAGVKAEEIASFASDLADFEATATGSSNKINPQTGLPDAEEAFVENKNFESEAAMLNAIDDDAIIIDETATIVFGDEIDLTRETPPQNATETIMQGGVIDFETASIAMNKETPGITGSADGKAVQVTLTTDAMPEKNLQPLQTSPRVQNNQGDAAVSHHSEPAMIPGQHIPYSSGVARNVVKATQADSTVTMPSAASSPASTKISASTNAATQTPSTTKPHAQSSAPVSPTTSTPVTEATPAKLATLPARSSDSVVAGSSGSLSTPQPKVALTPAGSAAGVGAVSRPMADAKPAQVQAVKTPPVAAAKADLMASVPGPAREIITRYPSFLADPFTLLFQPARPDVQLKLIGQVTDSLIGFLNLCFLQSCLFYAQESDVLTRSIKECLKGHLTGPTALRCLHNFALSMKAARGSPVFFTFSLAGILGESSDTNPLMLLRELKEYLRDPAQPLAESLPQAIEGLTEILRGIKSILNNTLVMKAPAGAKEPFADLSGPEARILPVEKRPGLDLPVGEVVLISRDGTEAFGLFPYFKYVKKKVQFARPDDREIAILYERLEIPAD